MSRSAHDDVTLRVCGMGVHEERELRIEDVRIVLRCDCGCQDVQNISLNERVFVGDVICLVGDDVKKKKYVVTWISSSDSSRIRVRPFVSSSTYITVKRKVSDLTPTGLIRLRRGRVLIIGGVYFDIGARRTALFLSLIHKQTNKQTHTHTNTTGDLAYPTPSIENYTKRFVRVFEQALPPPTRRSMFSVNKAAFQTSKHTCGPIAYLVPGNHDYFDGLHCFLKFVINSDWLGGWLMPQRKSYFALKLPMDWYVFGLDNGLTEDIDATQCAYFARLADGLPSSAKIIIVTHDPNWILENYEGSPSHKKYLSALLSRSTVKSKLRLRLAGDIRT